VSNGGDFWLHSRRFDLIFFVGPALLSLALVCPILLGWWPQLDTPVWAWLALVLGVDVAHVWSSLYRVYLDPQERRRRPWLYYATPICVYAASSLLYALDPTYFWTTLAYVAVHHFVRQQVGFVALYAYKAELPNKWTRRIDNWAVYVGTLVPIIHWHTSLPRNFTWFVEGDFLIGLSPEIMPFAWALYGVVACLYIGRRVLSGTANPGKDLTMAATWCMWFVGIVATDSDYVFTATNVLIHGIPYMALIWLVNTRRDSTLAPGHILSQVARSWVLFAGLLLVIAFAEEGLWDIFVWHDHPGIFGAPVDPSSLSSWIPLLFVPLLSVPQTTHYILDGFIWRLDGSNPGLKEKLFLSEKAIPDANSQ
jgi:hypothetical protein